MGNMKMIYFVACCKKKKIDSLEQSKFQVKPVCISIVVFRKTNRVFVVLIEPRKGFCVIIFDIRWWM